MTDVQAGGNYAPERITGGTLDDGQIASKKGLWGWALFDWAAQPFFTVLTTFIFVPYFTSQVIGNGIEGQSVWGFVSGGAAIVIAILSIFFGPIADRLGARKPWIMGCAIIGAIGCLLLWSGTPNSVLTSLPDNLQGLAVEVGAIQNWLSLPVIITMTGLVVATVALEVVGVFYNAMLPTLVRPEWMGRLSGYAWSLGYIGGMIMLIVGLVGFTALLGAPLFPVDPAAGEGQRLLGPISAAWLLVFTLPFWFWTPDVPATGMRYKDAFAKSGADIKDAFALLLKHPNILRFLVARTIYNDGVLAVIGFGGVYAAGVFGWGIVELGMFGILLNICAVPGSFLGGWLDDRFGAKRTIIAAVSAFTIATFGIVSLTKDHLLFIIPIAGPSQIQAADSTLLTESSAALQAQGFTDMVPVIAALGAGDETQLSAAREAAETALKDSLKANIDGDDASLAALSGVKTLIDSMKPAKIFTPQEITFFLLSILIGLSMGPIQASSRVMMARLAPPEQTGTFFGIYQMSGKATAWIGPLLIGVFTAVFESQRAGMVPVLLMFAIGLVLFLPVKDNRAPSNN